MSIEATSIARSARGSSPITENSIAESKKLWPTSSRARILFCDPGEQIESIAEACRSRGYEAIANDVSRPLAPFFRSLLPGMDIVILDVSNRSQDVLTTLADLNSAIGICNVRPRLLCFSTKHRNPEFVLKAERCGARYVRIEHPSILMETIELLLAEMSVLERDGPCFQIWHRFSQGTCAPGEEVAGAFLSSHGEFRQLPLAVVERLIFDFLAHHKRVALDSSQIVSGLNGGWFYKEHAANSGHKQVKKIRKASVKVLVQRIREALASSFSQAGLRFDPRDVLRSCPAEGTNKVAYKLHADVRWHHVGPDLR